MYYTQACWWTIVVNVAVLHTAPAGGWNWPKSKRIEKFNIYLSTHVQLCWTKLQSNFNSFYIDDVCYSKGKENNAVSMSMVCENLTVVHVSKEQHTSDFKWQHERSEGSTADDVSQQSTIETPRGIANSAQSSYKPIYVRTNSGVAKLITGINDVLIHVSWYEPRQSKPTDLFSGQDAQISERYKHYDALWQVLRPRAGRLTYPYLLTNWRVQAGTSLASRTALNVRGVTAASTIG